MLITLWNAMKALWSRANDAIKAPAPRAPVPTFTTPDAVAAYLQHHALYTGDPAGGAFDFYLSPERFQAAMLAGREAQQGLAIDCDDWATWAYRALQTVPECRPALFTLWDGSGKFGHHVICAYQWRTRFGVVDTNGHRLVPSLDGATLCRVFTELYASRGYRYTTAEPTTFPF